MRKHDKCVRVRRRHAAPPLPAVDFVAVRARAAVHSAAAVAPTSAAPVLRLAAAAVLLFPAARASLSRARARLACVAAAPPLAAAPLTASYKGAAFMTAQDIKGVLRALLARKAPASQTRYH